MSAYSKSSKYYCIIKEVGSGKDSKQFLEVWAECSLIKNYDLSALDVHGKVYADSMLKYQIFLYFQLFMSELN